MGAGFSPQSRTSGKKQLWVDRTQCTMNAQVNTKVLQRLETGGDGVRSPELERKADWRAFHEHQHLLSIYGDAT